MRKVFLPLAVVLVLIALAAIGLYYETELFFSLWFPVLAYFVFVTGVIWRVLYWAGSPVPFRISTTCGQGRSLPWIPYARLDNPITVWGSVVRVALELLLFRSLFRNTRFQFVTGSNLQYVAARFLWFFSLLFHYSLLVVVLRHLRFFTEPVPFFVSLIERGDSLLLFSTPLYLSAFLVLGSLVFLTMRRLVLPEMRYLSLAADYFPLFLLTAIVLSGFLMRYALHPDVISIKQLILGLVTFQPQLSAEIGMVFYLHLFLVCTLMIYFPFSKLMHFVGILMSPTRNLANNSRMSRHINPWDDRSLVPYSYAAYEESCRESLKDAGLPLENRHGQESYGCR